MDKRCIEIKNITMDFVLQHLMENYPGLKSADVWGETSLFYNPDGVLKRGIYFCTLKNKDGENDKASYLNRADVFRMNFGVSKKTFLSMFQVCPKRPIKGGVIDGDYHFQSLDILTPHPIYGWMAWISIINPSHKSLEGMRSLIDESYQICMEKYQKKIQL